MIPIAIDGLDEEGFRRSIELMLRRGDFDRAAERLRALLAPYVGVGKMLPPQFLRVSPGDLSIAGWDRLGESVARHDRPDHPVTALSICFTHPPENAPPAAAAQPWFETTYYSDNAFTFSQSTRDDLLGGYSTFGCDWAGDGEASDSALALAGIDDLHGALARLEARLLASEEPDPEEIRAGSLGTCYLSVLLFQTLRDTHARTGLPRPLCILAGNTDVYPYFDAPVTGIEDPEAGILDEAGGGAERAGTAGASQYASLLMSRIPRAKKRAVLVLDESIDETEQRVARLRGLVHEDAKPAAVEADSEPENLPVPAGPDATFEPAMSGPDPLAELRSLLKTKPKPGATGDGWSGGGAGAKPGFDLIDFDEPAGREQTCVRFKLDTAIFAETLRASAAPLEEPATAPALADEPPQYAELHEPSWQTDSDPLWQPDIETPPAEEHDIAPAHDNPGPDIAPAQADLVPDIAPAPPRPDFSERPHPFRHSRPERGAFAGPAWLGKLIDRYRALTARWRV